MSLIRCPECDGMVSSRAAACPRCGCPPLSRSGASTAFNGQGVAFTLTWARRGQKREYQVAIGTGRRTQGVPSARTAGNPPPRSPARSRRSASIGTRQLMVVMALAFFLFFGSRVVWSTVSIAADRVSAPRASPSPSLTPTASARDWKNSLGMEFVRVGDLWVAVREARNQDFAAFVRTTGYKARIFASPAASSERAADPVVSVSWEDASAFCRWLTEVERRQSRLAEGQFYRLPTDEEWSRLRACLPVPGDGVTATPLLWEWCQDTYEGDPNYRVYRIGMRAPPQSQDRLVGYRGLGYAARPADNRGFRCVLQTGDAPPPKLLARAGR